MELIYRFLFPVLWLAWGAYWLAASRGVKTAVRVESRVSRLLHILPLLLAGWLLAASHARLPLLGQHWLAPSLWTFWTGIAITLTGIGLTVWARVHLGRNWSGLVTVKADHQLIMTGPYRLMRHPIYAGLLLGFAGSALARTNVAGLLALALVLWALWRKLRLEERWMNEQFGSHYQDYSERVSALVPHLP